MKTSSFLLTICFRFDTMEEKAAESAGYIMDEYITILIIMLIVVVVLLIYYIYKTYKYREICIETERSDAIARKRLYEELNKKTKEIDRLNNELKEQSEETDRYRCEYAELKNKYDILRADYGKLKVTVGKEYYTNTIEYLFPGRIVLNYAEDNMDFQRYVKMITARVDLIEKYKKALELYKDADPHIYILLSEAYSNKIFRDRYNDECEITAVLPLVSKIQSELHTLYLENKAQLLKWGDNKQRAHKVESIRELREQTQKQLENSYYANYQLQYLLTLYPQLEDVLNSSYSEIKDEINSNNIEDFDKTRLYLSKDEYSSLTETERNQLALDRYLARNKSKWQIGRDYEQYIGWLCETKGYSVEYTGMSLKLEDMGRDLIVHSDSAAYIIQCKNWSMNTTIHEKHIMQLYGSLKAYEILNEPSRPLYAVFVTSATLSDTAQKFAAALGVIVYERIQLGDFPHIKCNINKNSEGITTRIYHLPMDLNYDTTKIKDKGEFYAYTVKEAEEAGFRHAYRFHGDFID